MNSVVKSGVPPIAEYTAQVEELVGKIVKLIQAEMPEKHLIVAYRSLSLVLAGMLSIEAGKPRADTFLKTVEDMIIVAINGGNDAN